MAFVALALGSIVVGVALLKIIAVVGRTMDRILKRDDLFEPVEGAPPPDGADPIESLASVIPKPR